MEYSIYIGLLVVVAICGRIHVKSKSKSKARARPDRIKKSEKPVISWGYAIKPPPGPGLPCLQAKKMSEKPIPVDSLANLPKLSLEGCNQNLGDCQYQAVAERHGRRYSV